MIIRRKNLRKRSLESKLSPKKFSKTAKRNSNKRSPKQAEKVTEVFVASSHFNENKDSKVALEKISPSSTRVLDSPSAKNDESKTKHIYFNKNSLKFTSTPFVNSFDHNFNLPLRQTRRSLLLPESDTFLHHNSKNERLTRKTTLRIQRKKSDLLPPQTLIEVTSDDSHELENDKTKNSGKSTDSKISVDKQPKLQAKGDAVTSCKKNEVKKKRNKQGLYCNLLDNNKKSPEKSYEKLERKKFFQKNPLTSKEFLNSSRNLRQRIQKENSSILSDQENISTRSYVLRNSEMNVHKNKFSKPVKNKQLNSIKKRPSTKKPSVKQKNSRKDKNKAKSDDNLMEPSFDKNISCVSISVSKNKKSISTDLNSELSLAVDNSSKNIPNPLKLSSKSRKEMKKNSNQKEKSQTKSFVTPVRKSSQKKLKEGYQNVSVLMESAALSYTYHLNNIPKDDITSSFTTPNTIEKNFNYKTVRKPSTSNSNSFSKKKIFQKQKKKSSVLSISDGITVSKKSVPTKGSLKRKRWIMSSLKNKNAGYEDDIFESSQYADFQDPKQLDYDSDTSLLSIETPKCAFMVTPNLPPKTPRFKDCYSPIELLKARKIAEEYIYRRNKKVKSSTINEPTPVRKKISSEILESFDENEILGVLPEKMKLDFLSATNKLAKKRKKLENDSDEDDYFSDLSSCISSPIH